jgi:hypothetical protein
LEWSTFFLFNCLPIEPEAGPHLPERASRATLSRPQFFQIGLIVGMQPGFRVASIDQPRRHFGHSARLDQR